MKRILLLLLSVFFLPILATADDVLDVGVVLPLSGDAANFGLAIQNGMNLAYSKLSPEDKKRITLHFEDDAFDPKRSISAFNALRLRGHADVLVNVGSQTSKALAPLADRLKIPFVAIASDPEVVEGKAYVVSFWVTPSEEVQAVLVEAKKRKYQNIVRIGTIHDFALAINREFDRQNQEMKVVLDEQYPLDVKDFKPFITKLRQRNDVDAVLTTLVAGHLGIFAKQLRQQGVNLPIFGFEFFEDPAEVKSSNGALLGQWYVNAANPSDSFVSDYSKAYPEGAFFGAATGYDAVSLILQASKQGGAQEINAYLHTAQNLSGALGTYSASGKNSFTLPAAIKQVTKDGFIQLDP